LALGIRKSVPAAYFFRLTDFLTLDFALWDFFFAPLRILVDFFTLLRAVLPLPAELFRVVAILDNLL
jgi:hypothetical protein